MNIGIAFICTNYNKYSIAALAGALDSARYDSSPVSSEPSREISLYFIDTRTGTPAMEKRFRELAIKHDKLIVCFSFTTINLVEIGSLANDIRNWVSLTSGSCRDSKLSLIAGGPHPSGDPLGTVKLGFDIAVIGEAEETFPNLVMSISRNEINPALNNDCSNSWRTVKGIAYLDGDKLVKTGRRLPVDLNRFAPFSIGSGKLSPIEISRGCPHACRFCQTSFLFGVRMRHRSIEEIVKYIELSKKNGTKDFRFISPNALAYGSKDGKSVDLKAIENLLRETSAITGKEHLFFGSFPSEVRPEAVSQEAIDLIKVYTGTKMLVVGAQSGSRRMLDVLHREHTVEDVDRAVRLTLKSGLSASIDFIFGLPGETEEDRKLSIKKMDEFAAMGAKIHSHTFIPLPGTPLAGADAGVIDKKTAVYLSRLANKGLQFGQWQKQQEMARESLGFRATVIDSDPQHKQRN
jgi:B12-binding domain/radical SAM domain protein